MSYWDWIQGEKFPSVAKWIYAPKKKQLCDYEKLQNTLFVSNLQDGDIIYTQGFDNYKRELLEIIRDTKKVILVSHNCDTCVDDSYNIPDNVIRWYTTHVKSENPKIESLPNGLQNNSWFTNKYIPEVVKKLDKMTAKLNEKKSLRNLIYMDHRIYSNPPIRQKPYDVLGNKTFVTSILDERIDQNNNSFDRYIDNVYNHRFVVSPEGNGIDPHRSWEVLYMGSYPIEIRNYNNRFYKDLPICFIDDWEEVTESFLTNWLIKNHGRKWNFDMLNFSYWKNKIQNEGNSSNGR
jgi:hypothetical protein